MFSLSFNSSKQEKKKVRRTKYYKCERCGYISIIKDSYCPICAKDGFKIKMK
jgi:rubrerythrin